MLAALFLGAALWAVPEVHAQHQVTGTVTDTSNGGTLPGVNVVVKGTEVGTATNGNGEYTIEAPSPQDTLEFSFIGFQTQDVPIDGRSEVDVTLQPAVTSLEEVVVSVGYGQQSVATTTGSVSQISGADLDAEPTTNLSNALQGRVPGLIGVNSNGRPGSDGSDLSIRGSSTLNNNSPLIVIDGVPGRQGGLERLNPSDIESISVLKDASAAIYGSRAANGVILVETKRGQAGETRINVNVERGYSQPTTVPDMADAPTFMTMLNEVNAYNEEDPTFSAEEIGRYQQGDITGNYRYHNTDWYDVALEDFSAETVADLSVTGGNERLRYYVSLQGTSEEGILVNSNTNYNQFGFRSNLDGDITEGVRLEFSLNGRLEQRNRPAWTRGLDSAWEMLQRGKPTEPAFWPTGEPGPAQEQGVNPVVAGATGYDDANDYYFQSNLSLEADIPGVDGWTAQGTVAYDQQFMDRKRWQKPWTLYSATNVSEDGSSADLIPVQTGVPEPRLEQWDANDREILLRATSTYENGFGDHNGSLLLGTEYQSADSSGIYAYRRFFPTDQIDQLFAGGQPQRANNGTGAHGARLNFFGRFNYNYDQKYLLELIGRYDGSYIFPEGDRFGFFPSVSAGWRLAQEDWFDDFTGDVFDRLKLRASFGQLGNDQIGPYQFLRTFGFNGQFAYGDGVDTRIAQTRVPNPDITWEVATKLDVGLEAALLGEALTLDVTYFRQFRDDILWFRSESLPETAGFSLPRENIGQVRSYGVEGRVGGVYTVSDNVTLRAEANLTYAENEIEYFAEAEGVVPWQQNTGRPINTGLYYVSDGIWSSEEEILNAIDNGEAVWGDAEDIRAAIEAGDDTWGGSRPGDIRFRDIDGDGEITGDDRRRVTENDRPDIIGGVNLGAALGSFDVQMFWQGAAQVQQYVFSGAVGTFGNYFQRFAEDRWTEDNPNASGPRSYNRLDPYWASNANTHFLRDAKYLRLKSARVAYTLPADLTQRFGMDRLQLYLSGRNLLTFSPLNIMDPEIRNGSAQTYPPERAYVLGIQMGF